MRVLIIDNNIDRDCWGAHDLVRFAVTAPGAQVSVRRGPQDDVPADLRAYDRVIVSGSRTSCLSDEPWLSRLEEKLRFAMNHSVRMLGVCFGHQMLVRAAGGPGRLRVGAVPEVGWTRIKLTRPTPLFEGLPSEFWSFSSHYEEVADLPPGFQLTAGSADCAIQGFEVTDKPIWGIQFHPEKDDKDAEKTFAERRRSGREAVLLHPKETRKLYDPNVGKKIFENFLQ